MIGDRSAVPVLIAALEADNTPLAAASAIARMGDERGVLPIIAAAALIRMGDAVLPVLPVLPVLQAQVQGGSVMSQLYAAAIPGYAGSPVDVEILQAVVQEEGPGQLADVAGRSIDLIRSFSRPADGFTEFAGI